MKLGKYFQHNRAERNGAIALLMIGTISLIIGEIYYRTRPPKTNSEALYQQFDSLLKVTEPVIFVAKLEPEFFHFDPNVLSDSGFVRLGFSEKEIGTLRKYQAAGGTFRKKADFGKLFFVDSAEYAALEPYLDLPDEVGKKSYTKESKFQNKWEDRKTEKWSDTADYKGFAATKKLIDLNTADSIQLVGIYGIGAFTAKSILRRRQELGGFYTIGQLMEIPKMTAERVDQIAPSVEIDLRQIAKIDINTATARALGAHPYCPMSLANSVVMNRETKGKYRDISDFCARNLVDPALCAKFAPYLAFL